MNVLICGHNNLIGKYLKETFEKEEIKHNFSYYENNSNDLLIEIIQMKYSHLIYCENYFINNKINDLNENINYNLYSPIKLALFCQLYKIHFTYIGNGNIYNFEDNLDKVFNEEDEPNFCLDEKRIILCNTDRLLKLTNSLNLRIPNLITNSLKDTENYIRQLLFKTKIGDIKISISILNDIIPIIVDLVKKREKGTFNLCNTSAISQNEILCLYKKYIDKDFKWKYVKNFRDEKDCYSILDTTLISLKYNIPTAYESIEKYLKEYENN